MHFIAFLVAKCDHVTKLRVVRYEKKCERFQEGCLKSLPHCRMLGQGVLSLWSFQLRGMQPSWLERQQPPSCTMRYVEDGNEIKDNKGEKQKSSESLMTSWSSRALRGWLSHALLCVETVATRGIL